MVAVDDSDTLTILSPYLAAVGLVLAWEGYRALRIAFLEWRWQRRMRTDPWLTREEERDYRLEVGFMAPDPDQPALGERLVVIGLELAAVLLCVALGDWMGWDRETIVLGVFAVIGLVAWLRKSLDPAPTDEAQASGPPDVEVPFDAVAGFAAAMLVVGLVLFVAWLA